ncbi:hypothetical protein Tco_1377129 [Tanacetum coccineum]
MLGQGFSLMAFAFSTLPYTNTDNGELLRKCIFDGPYLPTNVLTCSSLKQAEKHYSVDALEDVETIHQHDSREQTTLFKAEKEAIFLVSDCWQSGSAKKMGYCALNERDLDTYARECRKKEVFKRTTRIQEKMIDDANKLHKISGGSHAENQVLLIRHWYTDPIGYSDPANRFAPDGEEIVTLTEE